MKYDMEMIQKIGLFEKVTRAKLKEAFLFRERLTFVVEKGELGKALGKNKEHLTKLESMLKQRLKIVEFDDDMLNFIVNFLKPLKIQKITQDGEVVTLQGADVKTNGLIIGARAQNLRALEEIVNKYFSVEEIKVV